MKSSIQRYKIGFLFLSVIALVLLGVVVSEAGATKEDNNTYKAANNIANKLNDYVSTNGSIPQSLSDINVNNVPGTISYQKLSDSQYKFCIDYKTKSTDFSPTTIEYSLLSSGLSTQNQSSGTSSGALALIIFPTHKKGNDCQTISPVIQPQTSKSSSGSDPYAQCDSIQNNTLWQQCIDNITNSQNPQTTTLN